MRTARIMILLVIAAAVSVPEAVAAGRLKLTDEAHLIFMRSEEKLARDVYLTLAEKYPDQPTFYTIATTSEQVHTDDIRDLLIKYKISDPEPNADAPGSVGVFESPYFGAYFTKKFVMLTEGATALLPALEAGALIEELDMKDINYCNQVIYDVFKLDPGTPCGLTATDVRALQNVLGNLLDGSRNHLCAYLSQIGAIIAPGCYEAQLLTQQEVWDIVMSQCSEFQDFVCAPQ